MAHFAARDLTRNFPTLTPHHRQVAKGRESKGITVAAVANPACDVSAGTWSLAVAYQPGNPQDSMLGTSGLQPGKAAPATLQEVPMSRALEFQGTYLPSGRSTLARWVASIRASFVR